MSELEPPIVDLTHDRVDLTICLVERRGGWRRAANAGGLVVVVDPKQTFRPIGARTDDARDIGPLELQLASTHLPAATPQIHPCKILQFVAKATAFVDDVSETLCQLKIILSRSH